MAFRRVRTALYLPVLLIFAWTVPRIMEDFCMNCEEVFLYFACTSRVQMVELVRVSLTQNFIRHPLTLSIVNALYITRKWDMPALQQLMTWSNSFNVYCDRFISTTKGIVKLNEDATISFVSTHGRRLLHLHI